jgi:regulator of nucleoside diphosphate kinase
MEQHDILVTEPDMERLRSLLASATRPLGRDKEHLETLEQELDQAQTVSAYRVPKDVITMNSRVRVRELDTGEEKTYTLVFPWDADFAQGKISVLAPIGTAILGRRASDVIEWHAPRGWKTLQVLKILYQPEAAGKASALNRHRKRAVRSSRHPIPTLEPQVYRAA